MSRTVLFQRNHFSISSQFLCRIAVLFQITQVTISTVSMSKKDLFQTIQFSVSTQFSSVWPIDRSLSGASIRLFRVISWHSLAGSYPSAEKQSMNSTAGAHWANPCTRECAWHVNIVGKKELSKPSLNPEQFCLSFISLTLSCKRHGSISSSSDMSK